jgi:hypothetical protein
MLACKCDVHRSECRMQALKKSQDKEIDMCIYGWRKDENKMIHNQH